MLKQRNTLIVIGLAVLLFVVFNGLTGTAGNLEPDNPPEPTMVTLEQLSAQVAALSSPVEKVVRGVVTFEKDGNAQAFQQFSPAVDPNRCVVVLSDAVAFNRDSSPTYASWVPRNGACLIDLTSNQITVQVESQSADQKVSYQIIEYK